MAPAGGDPQEQDARCREPGDDERSHHPEPPLLAHELVHDRLRRRTRGPVTARLSRPSAVDAGVEAAALTSRALRHLVQPPRRPRSGPPRSRRPRCDDSPGGGVARLLPHAGGAVAARADLHTRPTRRRCRHQRGAGPDRGRCRRPWLPTCAANSVAPSRISFAGRDPAGVGRCQRAPVRLAASRGGRLLHRRHRAGESSASTASSPAWSCGGRA